MHCFYRYTATSAARNRPRGFDKQLAFQSFLSAFAQLGHPSLTVVSDCSEDGHPGLEVPSWATVVELGGGGGGRSFEWCLREAVRLPQSELVYFAEDDYFYVPEAFVALEAAANELGPDVHSFYFSLYEHPDAYVSTLHPQSTRLRILGDHHWRELPSTCMTFGASPLRLSLDLDLILGSLSRKQTASWALFPALQGRGKASALKWQIRRQIAESNSPRDADLVRIGRLLAPRSRAHVPLLAPVPSLATHAAEGALPFGLDWSTFGLDGGDRDAR